MSPVAMKVRARGIAASSMMVGSGVGSVPRVLFGVVVVILVSV